MANISHENQPRLRLTKPFFYILVFLLPIQLRKIFFTTSSFFADFHAFYNTWFLYLTDLLILCLIASWIWEFSRENRDPSSATGRLRTIAKSVVSRAQKDSVYLFAIAFWLSLAISLLFSRENFLGLYGLVKITEFLLLFSYVRENIDFSAEKSSQPKFSTIIWLLVISASLQSLLGIYQYVSQSSLGLRFLGEEFLRPGLKGVAKYLTHGTANPLLFTFFPNLNPISSSVVNMRAYGTFPHPNVFGAFLFFAILGNLYLLYFSREKFWSTVCFVLLCTGMVVTFSRFAWLVTFLGVLVWLGFILVRFRRQNMFSLKSGQLDRLEKTQTYFPGRVGLILGALLMALVINVFLFGSQIRDRITGEEIRNIAASESFLDRKTYGNIAWQMFKANPIFGVGLHNFVVNMDDYNSTRLLPYQHQPAHNIYLLILAEAGIFALVSFLLFLGNIVRHSVTANFPPLLTLTLLLVFFGFLFLGLFDHYFLSIQQGGLLFWLVAGLLAAPSHQSISSANG